MRRGSDTPGLPKTRRGSDVPVQPFPGVRSTLQSSLIGISYRCRLLVVGLKAGLARLVAESARHAGRHRAGQLEGIRRARAEEPQRRGHAPEETITLREAGRHG